MRVGRRLACPGRDPGGLRRAERRRAPGAVRRRLRAQRAARRSRSPISTSPPTRRPKPSRDLAEGGRAEAGADRHRPWHDHRGLGRAFRTRSRPSAATSRPTAAAPSSPSPTDVAEDAARRDFTMNALYADPDGTRDRPAWRAARPSGPAGALRRRRRPRGSREDYLRILRFFRFHAWYGDPEGGLDPEGLAACAEQSEPASTTLSTERIGAEMRKLLAAPDPAPAVAAMAAAGVLGRVLPGADPRAAAGSGPSRGRPRRPPGCAGWRCWAARNRPPAAPVAGRKPRSGRIRDESAA